MTEKITVIVPVYNVKAEYFDRCVKSICDQTYRELELLIVDDGSDTETAFRCDSAAKADHRIRVIHRENGGASAARNTGLREASGAYITFVDCDDWIDEHCLEAAYERAGRDDLDILLWGSFKCYGDRHEKYMPYSEDIELFDKERKKELMQKTMVGTLKTYRPPATVFGSGSCCSKLYRKDFLDRNGLFYPEGIKRAEDVNFNIRAFDAAERIGYLNRHLYYYRQHEHSASFIYRRDGIEVFTAALLELEKFIREKKADEDFLQAWYMRCIFFFLESMDMDYLNRENHDPLSETLYRMRKAASRSPYREAAMQVDMKRLSFFKKIPVFFLRHDLMELLVLFYGIYGRMKKTVLPG